MTYLSNKNHKLSSKERAWLRSQLCYGDIKRIAEMSHYSTSSVNQFFRGINNNTYILEAIIILISKKQDAINKIQELIEKQ